MATCTQIIEGMQVLMKYETATDQCSVAADHEVIYCGAGFDGELTDEDKAKLETLGWFFHEEFDCWARFT